MTKYCVIDTEGNGLFDYSKPADAPGQPRLAELAMILLREDMSIEEEYRALVKPEGWAMAPEATAINRLTTEMLEEKGLPLGQVLDVYEQAIHEGFAIVAFNAQHDCKTMRAELRRSGRDDLFTITHNVCVMRKAKGVIPRPDGKKSWPSLAHCRAFLKLPHELAHSAGADARSALEVLRYLHSQGVDLTPEVHYAKNQPDVEIPKQEWDARETNGGGSGRVRSDALPPISDKPVSRPRSSALPPLAEEKIPE